MGKLWEILQRHIDERKRIVHLLQQVQQRQNEISKLIPKEKDAPKKQELIKSMQIGSPSPSTGS